MTLLDALRERSSEANLRRAIDALIAAMPVGRAVEITPEVVAAAAAGDVALVATLLAEETEADETDLVALREADAADDGTRVSLDDACRELGLSR